MWCSPRPATSLSGIPEECHLLINTFTPLPLEQEQVQKTSEIERQERDVFMPASISILPAWPACQLPHKQLAGYPCSPAGQPAYISLQLAHGNGKARLTLTRGTLRTNDSFGYSVDTKRYAFRNFGKMCI